MVKESTPPADHSTSAPAAVDKPNAKKTPKEKAPALEDKPFSDFIRQDYLPALKAALISHGLGDLVLNFDEKQLPILNLNCWQVSGLWMDGQRQFNLAFPDGDIQGAKVFTIASHGSQPSTLEPFLIDERKSTLDLLVLGIVKRLNGQKWLARN